MQKYLISIEGHPFFLSFLLQKYVPLEKKDHKIHNNHSQTAR